MSTTETDDFVCVNCMSPVENLYTKYSKDVIRITDCSKCNKVADKYVEYDPVLVFNELFLQYSTAYRHLLLNNKTFNAYARLGMAFIIADAYNKWIKKRASLNSDRIYDLEWSFYECLLQSFIETFTYLFTGLLLSKIATTCHHSNKFFISRSIFGFFGNVFVVFCIIWQLHEHLSYRLLTALFIFVTQVQVERTLCPASSLATTMLIVLLSTAARFASGSLFASIISTVTFVPIPASSKHYR